MVQQELLADQKDGLNSEVLVSLDEFVEDRERLTSEGHDILGVAKVGHEHLGVSDPVHKLEPGQVHEVEQGIDQVVTRNFDHVEQAWDRHQGGEELYSLMS